MSSPINQIFTFVSTIPGAVRLACIIFNFCGGVSMAASWATNSSRGSFFNFTAWFGLIVSIFFFFLHSLDIHQRPAFRQFPWHLIELIYCLVWTFFYLIASSCIAGWWHTGAPTAFGFITCAIYVGLCYLSYTAWKTGQDTVDNIYSEYDTSGMSYQNSEPGNMTRPGTDPGLPAPHMMSSQMTVPVVTVTSPASNARLELVD